MELLIGIIQLFGIPLVLTLAVFWTYFEGRKLKARGANLSPVVWAILVYIFFIIAFPLFIALKVLRWNIEATRIEAPQKLKQWQRILVIIAFFAVYILTFILFAWLGIT